MVLGSMNLLQILEEQYNYMQYTYAVHISNWSIGIHHYSVYKEQNNDECQWTNWKCVLHKCTACNSIALPGFEGDSLNQAPLIMFNTFMTKFNYSHHGILICEKITTYLDAKVTPKRLVSYMNN